MPTYDIKYVREIRTQGKTSTAHNPQQAAVYLLSHCFNPQELWRESVWAVYVDTHNKVVGQMLIGTGGFDYTPIDIRLIIKGALDSQAHSVIIAHNHPSGNPFPSQGDIEKTEQIRKACTTFQLKLLDHIIIGETEWYSFQEEKTRPIPFQELTYKVMAGEASTATASFIRKAIEDFLKENPTGDSFELATHMYNLGRESVQSATAK